MRRIVFKKKVNARLKDVEQKINSDFFSKMFPRLSPLGLLNFEGTKEGGHFTLGIKLPITLKLWQGVLQNFEKGPKEFEFTDLGEKLPMPLTEWRHRHRFVESSLNNTYIIDEISFSCVDSRVEFLMEVVLIAYFKYRHMLYKKLL